MTEDNIKNIVDVTVRMNARRLAQQITALNALRNCLPRPRALTRREKVVRYFRNWKYRLTTAWCVLRGDDIHDDCR